MLRKIALPHWLDGQTIALLTLLTAFGALMQTGFTNIRGEMGQLRGEMSQLRGEIGQLRSEIRADLQPLDDRLRNVELKVSAIEAGLGMLERRVVVLEAHHAAPPAFEPEAPPS